MQSQAGGMNGFGMSGNAMQSQMPMGSGNTGQRSPVSQQASMGSQGNSTGFPYGGQNIGGGMDPRTILNNLTPQQQAQFASLPPQQRQMFVFQQQQQMLMRSGNPSASSSVNPQMMAAAQQRGPQNPQGMNGMPMDEATAVLRSNATMPGIARSTRTPSDHMTSPMTPQMSQRVPGHMSEDYQRAMLQNNQRAMASQMPGQGVPSFPSGPQGGNWQPQVGGSGQGSYGGSPPGSAGPGASFTGSSSSPSPSLAGNWNPNPGAFPSGMDPGGMGNPAMSPQAMGGANSPVGSGGMNEYDIFSSWT